MCSIRKIPNYRVHWTEQELNAGVGRQHMSLMRYYIGGGDARHSWPGSTLARISTQVTQVTSNRICYVYIMRI